MQPRALVLASGSGARARLLRAAGLSFRQAPVGLDEAAIIESLRAEGHPPRNIADALAEMKALKSTGREPDALIIAGDQVLALGDEILTKPGSRAAAAAQLARLSGRVHELFSAVCLATAGAVIWRHVAAARLTMRRIGPETIETYLDEAGPDVIESVGAYAIEGRGVQLFSAIDGDLFTIQGLPLLPLLQALRDQGVLPA